jgi:hypothetical protein
LNTPHHARTIAMSGLLTLLDKFTDKWYIPPDTSEELFAPAGSALVVQGASGQAAAKINGIYAAVEDMFDRASVYKVRPPPHPSAASVPSTKNDPSIDFLSPLPSV